MMTWSSRLSGALGHNRTKAAAAFACFLSMAPLAVLAAVERVQVQLPPPGSSPADPIVADDTVSTWSQRRQDVLTVWAGVTPRG